MGEKPLVGEFKLKLGSSMEELRGKEKPSRGGEGFETLLYTFKPESVQNKPGVIWKEKDISLKNNSEKVFVEFNSGASDETVTSGLEASHKFEGMFQATGAGHHDYVLIVEGNGEARLEKLSGSTTLKKLSGGKVPETHPLPLPDNLKRKFAASGGSVKSAKTSDSGAAAPSRSPVNLPTQPIGQSDSSSDASSSDSDSDSDGGPKVLRIAYY